MILKPFNVSICRNIRLRKMSFTKLLALALLVHAVLLYAVFDVYFTSPLVTGVAHRSVSSYSYARRPFAQRLVLFVADGLRADKFFYASQNTPYFTFAFLIMFATCTACRTRSTLIGLIEFHLQAEQFLRWSLQKRKGILPFSANFKFINKFFQNFPQYFSKLF